MLPFFFVQKREEKKLFNSLRLGGKDGAREGKLSSGRKSWEAFPSRLPSTRTFTFLFSCSFTRYQSLRYITVLGTSYLPACAPKVIPKYVQFLMMRSERAKVFHSFFMRFFPFHALSVGRNRRKIVNGNHHNQHPRNFYARFFSDAVFDSAEERNCLRNIWLLHGRIIRNGEMVGEKKGKMIFSCSSQWYRKSSR